MVYTKMMPLYGVRPFATTVELLGDDAQIGWNRVSDDLERLEEPEDGNALPLFNDLQVKRSDLRRYIKEARNADMSSLAEKRA